MMRISTMMAITVLAFAAAACSFSTASLADLKFAKDDKGTQTITSGNVGEKIFAVSSVQNNIGNVKVKFTLYFENVQGKGKGDKAANVDLDVDGSREVIFNFTPPMPGDYRVDAVMTDDTGKEMGKKSATISVKGEAPKAPEPKSDADDDSDDN